jgi:hypothetical protein
MAKKNLRPRDKSGRWNSPSLLEEARWLTSQDTEARAQHLDEDLNLDQELAAKIAGRRDRLKVSILALISEYSDYGPMLRSQVYETLHGGRHKDIFSQAVEELLAAGDIIRTESRDGTRGRIGVAYTLAPR